MRDLKAIVESNVDASWREFDRACELGAVDFAGAVEEASAMLQEGPVFIGTWGEMLTRAGK